MKPTTFEQTIDAFFEHRPFRRGRQGYSTDGERFRLNGHLIAEWHDSAVRMYLNDPVWHPFLLAQAIVRVRRVSFERGYLAEPEGRACKLHSDCRGNLELGKACILGRPAPKKPFTGCAGERRLREGMERDERERLGTLT